MLIDITIAVTNIVNSLKSSPHRTIKLCQLKGQNNILKNEYTCLSHDYNLVAWEAKLFDSLSKDDFGMSIRINLIIARKLNPETKRVNH
jgi:hypothetical protein